MRQNEHASQFCAELQWRDFDKKLSPHELYRIAGNFRGRKLSRICGLQAVHKSFLHKMLTYTDLQKFSPSSITRL